MSLPTPAETELRFPTRRLGLALFVAALTPVAITSLVDARHRQALSSEARHVGLERLRGKILLLDEVLTMSARMAAATGDASWRARYEEAEPELAQALADALALAPDAFTVEGVRATDTANRTLVAMELAAFRQVERGNLDDARAILGGESYASMKAAYRTGVERVVDTIDAHLRRQRERVGRQYLVLLALSGLVVMLLIGVAGVTLRSVRQWARALVDAQGALARLNGQLERRVLAQTEEVRALARSLTEAELSERRRIAQLLHDDLQQALVGARMRIESVERRPEAPADRLAEARADLDKCIEATRELSRDLYPPELGGSDLESALVWVVERAAGRHGMEVELIVPRPDRPIPSTILHLALDASKEMLFNVVKHAGVHQAELRAWVEDHKLELEVRDRGRGLGLDDPSSRGVGLLRLGERAQLLGGRLWMVEAPGGGTRARLELPLDQSEPA